MQDKTPENVYSVPELICKNVVECCPIRDLDKIPGKIVPTDYEISLSTAYSQTARGEGET